MAEWYFTLKRWLGRMGLRNTVTRRKFKMSAVLYGIAAMTTTYLCKAIILNEVGVKWWGVGLLFSWLVMGRYILDSCRNMLGLMVLTVLNPLFACWLCKTLTIHPELLTSPGAVLLLVGVLMLLYDDTLRDNWNIFKLAGIRQFLKIKLYYFQRDILMYKQELIWAQQEEVQAFKKYLKVQEIPWYNESLQYKKEWIENVIVEEKTQLKLDTNVHVTVTSSLSEEDEYLFCKVNQDADDDYILEFNAHLLQYVSLEETLCFVLQAIIEIKANNELPLNNEDEEMQKKAYIELFQRKETLAYDVLTGYYAKNKGSFYLYG